MIPIILVVCWTHALHLMHLGDWCTRAYAGHFDCTARAPRPGPVILKVTWQVMSHLIRHGYECTHGWLCTPNQIP